MIRFLLPGVWLLVSSFSVTATTVFEESFSTYAGRGLSPGGGNGTLDSMQWQIFGASDGDSVFGEHTSNDDFARGITAGGVRSGGIYAVLLADDKRGLGVQATSADFTPGALLWTLTNLTDRWLDHLTLSFELWWLNDGNRSTTIDTLVSGDGSTWKLLNSQHTPSASDNLGWQLRATNVPIGSFSRSAAAQATPERLLQDGLAPGTPFWLRWQFADHAGRGSRDEIALTALRIHATDRAQRVNEPRALWLGTLAGALLIVMSGTRRHRRA